MKRDYSTALLLAALTLGAAGTAQGHNPPPAPQVRHLESSALVHPQSTSERMLAQDFNLAPQEIAQGALRIVVEVQDPLLASWDQMVLRVNGNLYYPATASAESQREVLMDLDGRLASFGRGDSFELQFNILEPMDGDSQVTLVATGFTHEKASQARRAGQSPQR